MIEYAQKSNELIEKELVEKLRWIIRFKEVKHNQDRLVNLMNDFYLCYQDELDVSEWHRDFYERVLAQLETVAV